MEYEEFLIILIIFTIIYFLVKSRQTPSPVQPIEFTVFATIDGTVGEADASIIITDLAGNAVDGGSGTTDVNGNFNFSLGPGTYKISALKGENGFSGEFEVKDGMAVVVVTLRELTGK